MRHKVPDTSALSPESHGPSAHKRVLLEALSRKEGTLLMTPGVLASHAASTFALPELFSF